MENKPNNAHIPYSQSNDFTLACCELLREIEHIKGVGTK